MLARLSFLFSFTESTVWIVGRLHRLLGPAESRKGWLDIGLGTTLRRARERGLRLDEASLWLEKEARGKFSRLFWFFHVGTNDLEENSKRTLTSAVHRLL